MSPWLWFGALIVRAPVLPHSSRGARGLLGQARDLHDRADFDGALGRGRNALGDADRLVEVLGVDDIEAAELLAGLGEGAVGDERLAFANPDTGRSRDRVQRGGRHVLAF